MTTILLVVYITAAVSMIVLILIQRSEGGALGMGGGGGGFVSGRGAANFLTRTTAILAAIFLITAVALGILSHRPAPASVVPGQAPAKESTPASAPASNEQAPATLPPIKIPRLKLDAEPEKAPAPAAPGLPRLPQSQ